MRETVGPAGVERHVGRVASHQAGPAHRHAGGGHLQRVEEGPGQEAGHVLRVGLHVLLVHQVVEWIFSIE